MTDAFVDLSVPTLPSLEDVGVAVALTLSLLTSTSAEEDEAVPSRIIFCACSMSRFTLSSIDSTLPQVLDGAAVGVTLSGRVDVDVAVVVVVVGADLGSANFARISTVSSSNFFLRRASGLSLLATEDCEGALLSALSVRASVAGVSIPPPPSPAPSAL